MSAVEGFLQLLADGDPKHMRSIVMAREIDPPLFEALGGRIVTSLTGAFPAMTLAGMIETYRIYTTEQNVLQYRYEESGHYPSATEHDANVHVYQNLEVMADYMAALLLTQFLWPHHLQVVAFFLDRFARHLGARVDTILEFASGHGLYGRLLLERRPEARLIGLDISPHSVHLATVLAAQEGLAERSTYRIGNVLDPGPVCPGGADVVIAGELLEHMDRPELVVDAVRNELADGGRGFVTAAITAASLDHVYEFRSGEEVLALVSGRGLDVLEHLLVAPGTVRRGATKVPQVLAMIVAKSRRA